MGLVVMLVFLLSIRLSVVVLWRGKSGEGAMSDVEIPRFLSGVCRGSLCQSGHVFGLHS